MTSFEILNTKGLTPLETYIEIQKALEENTDPDEIDRLQQLEEGVLLEIAEEQGL